MMDQHDRPPPAYLDPAVHARLRDPADPPRGVDRPLPPYLAPPPEELDDEPVPARSWGKAAAVALGLGLVLLTSWQVWDQVSPSAEREAGTAVLPTGSAGPGADPYYSGQGTSGGPASGGTQGGDGQTTNLPPASEGGDGTGVGQFAGGADGGPTTTVPIPPALSPEDAPPVRVAEAAPAAPSETTPAASTSQRPSSDPGTGAGSGAAVPDRLAPVNDPPAAAPPPRQVNMARAARWIGGGPSNADNPQGRYQGTVAVQVAVEPNGTVSKCAAVRGSGNASLDAATCRLVRERARFDPALNAQGSPIASQAYTTIVWGRRERRK